MKAGLVVSLIFFLCLSVSSGVVLAAEELSWQELNEKVTSLYKMQQFAKAEKYARQAVRVARKAQPPDPEKLTIALNNLAMITTHLGNFGEAEALNKESLGIRQRTFGMTDPGNAVSWNNLGLIYYFVKKMDDAEHCFREALYILEKNYGPDSRKLRPALERLLTFYDRTGNEKKAAEIQKRLDMLPADSKAHSD